MQVIEKLNVAIKRVNLEIAAKVSAEPQPAPAEPQPAPAEPQTAPAEPQKAPIHQTNPNETKPELTPKTGSV